MSELLVSGTIEQRIAAIAAAQRGRVSRGQLLLADVSSASIARLANRGYLWPEHRGVYAVGHLAETPGGREAAALLAVRRGAALSHGTGRRWWGMIPTWYVGVRPDRPVEITLPGERAPGPEGVTVHRSTVLADADIRLHDGLPVTSPARTLLDLAATAPSRELERALDTALVERIVTLTDVAELLSRCGRHAGRSSLTALVAAERATTVTRSEAEERFLAIVRGADLPQPLVNARRFGVEIDFLWPDHRYAVEIDGAAFHFTKRRTARDLARTERLDAAGIHLDRLGWHDLTKAPLATAAVVARGLAGSDRSPH